LRRPGLPVCSRSGDQGETVVRWHRTRNFVITPLGLGTTMPLLNSAHRRVFLSYSPCPVIEPLLRQEREPARALGLRVADIVSEADFGGRLTRVRTSAFRWRKQARPVGSLASQEPAARAR
jgi:DNA-binding IclR family transcriptional regulator